MRTHPIPRPLIALLADLHTAATNHLSRTSTAPLNLHAVLDRSPVGTIADKAWVSGLLDSSGLTQQYLAHAPLALANLDVLSLRDDALHHHLRTAFSPAWPDLHELTVDCATMTAAEARHILQYARTHRTAQRNALRALDRASGLETGPSLNAVAAVVDALEHNPRLAAGRIPDHHFGVLCDELAGAGRALTVTHLIGSRGTGRFRSGHRDALTAAYRTFRSRTQQSPVKGTA